MDVTPAKAVKSPLVAVPWLTQCRLRTGMPRPDLMVVRANLVMASVTSLFYASAHRKSAGQSALEYLSRLAPGFMRKVVVSRPTR